MGPVDAVTDCCSGCVPCNAAAADASAVTSRYSGPRIGALETAGLALCTMPERAEPK